jgi:hypothetical protein
MAALTKERNTPTRHGDHAVIRVIECKVAATTTIYAGSLVMIDGGYAKPAATATGKVVLGRARQTVDNSAGAAGDKTVEVERGTFKWTNATAGDAIAQANVWADAYALDDQTVTITATGRSKAGKIVAIEADGVWVESLGLA